MWTLITPLTINLCSKYLIIIHPILMQKKVILIDVFVWNLTDGDLLMKVWSENVHSGDQQNEEYKDQNFFWKES